MPDPEDGRRTGLVATELARHEARQALAPLLAEISGVTDALGDRDAAVVRDFLHEMTAAVARAAESSQG